MLSEVSSWPFTTSVSCSCAVFSAGEIAEMGAAFERLRRVAERRARRRCTGAPSSSWTAPTGGAGPSIEIHRIVWCGAAEPVLGVMAATRACCRWRPAPGLEEQNHIINQATSSCPRGVEFLASGQHPPATAGGWADVKRPGQLRADGDRDRRCDRAQRTAEARSGELPAGNPMSMRPRPKRGDCPPASKNLCAIATMTAGRCCCSAPTLPSGCPTNRTARAGVHHGFAYRERTPGSTRRRGRAPRRAAMTDPTPIPLRILVVDDNVDAADSLACC